jgi:precorrin-2 dehydrogenase / sirohydrochlorin ferrochelatase
MSQFFPINLNIQGRKCLVIGGGKVAERKAESLLQCGADIYLVSPKVTQNLEKLAENGFIKFINRGYNIGDLDGCFLVISATNDQQVNKSIADDCLSRNILINVVDDPDKCNFTLPSVLHRGALCIAVSTDGKSPTLAKKIREELEEHFGVEYAEFLELLGEVRDHVIRDVPDEKKRRMIFECLVDSDILDLIRKGDKELVSKQVAECISLATV